MAVFKSIFGFILLYHRTQAGNWRLISMIRGDLKYLFYLRVCLKFTRTVLL